MCDVSAGSDSLRNCGDNEFPLDGSDFICTKLVEIYPDRIYWGMLDALSGVVVPKKKDGGCYWRYWRQKRGRGNAEFSTEVLWDPHLDGAGFPPRRHILVRPRRHGSGAVPEEDDVSENDGGGWRILVMESKIGDVVEGVRKDKGLRGLHSLAKEVNLRYCGIDRVALVSCLAIQDGTGYRPGVKNPGGGLPRNIRTVRPMEMVQVDGTPMIPCVSGGILYNGFLTFVDVFSHFSVLRPVVMENQYSVASAVNDFCKDFLPPEKFRVDAGMGMQGPAVRAMCTLYGCGLEVISNSNPNANAYVERAHQTAKNTIEWLLHNRNFGQCWADVLAQTQILMNTRLHRSFDLLLTPAQVFFGRDFVQNDGGGCKVQNINRGFASDGLVELPERCTLEEVLGSLVAKEQLESQEYMAKVMNGSNEGGGSFLEPVGNGFGGVGGDELDLGGNLVVDREDSFFRLPETPVFQDLYDIENPAVWCDVYSKKRIGGHFKNLRRANIGLRITARRTAERAFGRNLRDMGGRNPLRFFEGDRVKYYSDLCPKGKPFKGKYGPERRFDAVVVAVDRTNCAYKLKFEKCDKMNRGQFLPKESWVPGKYVMPMNRLQQELRKIGARKPSWLCQCPVDTCRYARSLRCESQMNARCCRTFGSCEFHRIMTTVKELKNDETVPEGFVSTQSFLAKETNHLDNCAVEIDSCFDGAVSSEQAESIGNGNMKDLLVVPVAVDEKVSSFEMSPEDYIAGLRSSEKAKRMEWKRLEDLEFVAENTACADIRGDLATAVRASLDRFVGDEVDRLCADLDHSYDYRHHVPEMKDIFAERSEDLGLSEISSHSELIDGGASLKLAKKKEAERKKKLRVEIVEQKKRIRKWMRAKKKADKMCQNNGMPSMDSCVRRVCGRPFGFRQRDDDFEPVGSVVEGCVSASSHLSETVGNKIEECISIVVSGHSFLSEPEVLDSLENFSGQDFHIDECILSVIGNSAV